MSARKAPRPLPGLDRTPSSHTRFVTAGVRCFERDFEGHEEKPPVRLVVFDCDETLTLSTFMPKDKALRLQIGWVEWGDYIAEVNFQSPFIMENRLEMLGNLFMNLKEPGADGIKRVLAVLTRNESGAIACLNLLTMAKLADHFDVMWSMQGSNQWKHGVYKSASGWQVFEPPVKRVPDHKADVLQDVCANPDDWFPQLKDRPDLNFLRELKSPNIALVDDVRTNFQSASPTRPKVLRYCKVARYDSEFKGMGMVNNMGGIGARNDDDFRVLEFFIKHPWKFKEANTIVCTERHFEGCDDCPPVKLIVFDFDETLSLYTFMPEEKSLSAEISPPWSESQRAHYVRYNFDSPYIKEGDRVVELRKLLRELKVSEEDEPRTLAVLTKNEFGAVAVLNLLLMANLADEFSVIWTLGSGDRNPSGVYKDGDSWKTFAIPFDTDATAYKADVLHRVIENPVRWFPQLASGAPEYEHLRDLDMPGVLVVDDDRSSFSTSDKEDDRRVYRYCKVAHYDDEFLDQGLLVHMGGLGAKNLADFAQLRAFVENPRLCRAYDSSLEENVVFMPPEDAMTPRPSAPVELERNDLDEKVPPTPAARRRTATGSKDLEEALAKERSAAS